MDMIVASLQIALAAILAVAGVGKLLDLGGSQRAVADFGIPRQYARTLGTALPFGELLLAVLLLISATTRLAAIGALLLFLAFIAGIAWNIRLGRHPDCHCFGEFHSSPAGWKTIIRNSVFSLMALFLIFTGDTGPVEAITDFSAGEVGVWLTALVLALGAAQLWLLQNIHRGQEAIRKDVSALRDDALFGSLESNAPRVAAPAPLDESERQPAPDFDLPALDGGRVTLDALRREGRPVMLLFTSPGCSFCSAMYPEVQEWGRRFSDDVTIAVIGRGDIEQNRAKMSGFEFPHIAVDESGDTSAAFDANATPAAAVVLPDGTLLEPVAGGRENIRQLLSRTLRHRPKPDVAPEEPQAATEEPLAAASWPAPSFELPTADGGVMSLSGLLERGKPVLLVFWNTGCSFCNHMGPELGEWMRRFDDEVTIAVVSTGPEEDVLDHVRRFGLTRVAMQDEPDLMRLAGSNGTPSAILIRPDGTVEDPVGGGAPGIRQLLGTIVSKPAEPASAGRNTNTPAPEEAVAASNGALDDGPATEEEAIRSFLLQTATSVGPAKGTPGSRLPWQDLDGGFVGLDDLRGADVVLVFWGVDCEFSQRLLPDLKEWEEDAGAAVDRTLIISAGHVERNRAQGLRSRVVIEDSFATALSFGISGTPAAIRLDQEGRVASAPAIGADAVMDLLYDFSESIAGSAAAMS